MYLFDLIRVLIPNEIVIQNQQGEMLWRGVNSQLPTNLYNELVQSITARGVYLYIIIY